MGAIPMRMEMRIVPIIFCQIFDASFFLKTWLSRTHIKGDVDFGQYDF
jgi:hypothetical protein